MTNNILFYSKLENVWKFKNIGSLNKVISFQKNLDEINLS